MFGIEFYFTLPQHLRGRITNENTNGLLREYLPKGQDLTNVNEKYLQDKLEELNFAKTFHLNIQVHKNHCLILEKMVTLLKIKQIYWGFPFFSFYF